MVREPAPPPTTLGDGRYRASARLGSGGVAHVWRAWDTRLQVWRAIKVLRVELASNAAVRRRFDQEARAMARLTHPHILAIRDVGDQDGQPFIVMDLAPGGSLADVVRRTGPVAPALACRWLEEILHALHHAHLAGVVHRDVKPHNVLLDEGRALVSDFGIARVADTGSDLTRTGSVVGTLAYMAPEQRSSAATVDGRADVYAAAAALYHLLTAGEPLDLYLEPPGAFDGVDPALADVVRRGVRYAPGERWPDALAMAAALAAIRPTLGPEPALPIDPPPPGDDDPGELPSASDTFSESRVDLDPAEVPAEVPSEVPPAVPPIPAVASRRAPLVAAAVVGGLALATGLWAWLAPPASPVGWVAEDVLAWLPADARLLGTDGRTVGWSDPSGYWTARFDDGADRRALDGEDGAYLDGELRAVRDLGDVLEVDAADGVRRFGLDHRAHTVVYVAPGADRVLFVGKDGLLVSRADGHSVRLAGGDEGVYSARWSPDGVRIGAVLDTGPTSARLAVLDVEPPAARYLAEEAGLVLPGARAALAWRDMAHLVVLRGAHERMAAWQYPVDGGPPERLFDVAAHASQLVWLPGDRALVGSQAVWRGVEVTLPGSSPTRERWEPGHDVMLLGAAGGSLILARGAEVSRWDPVHDVEEALGGAYGGTWGDAVVVRDADGVHLGDLVAPDTFAGELRCLDASCWVRDGSRFLRFDPVQGLAAVPTVEFAPEYSSGWAVGAGGVLLIGSTDGLILVDPDGRQRSFGTFGMTFVQHVAGDGADGAWVSGFRDGRWQIGHWTPSAGYTAVLDRPSWIGAPTPLPDGTLAFSRLYQDPRSWQRWSPVRSDRR